MLKYVQTAALSPFVVDSARMRKGAEMRLKSAFTLIELLVVISVIAVLLAILMPALRLAQEQARSIACRNHLKTLSLANELYAQDYDGAYVPAVDLTMSDPLERSWNVNPLFRRYIALNSKITGQKYDMPDEYLCPTDKVRRKNVWLNSQTGFRQTNKISYGYNVSDWMLGTRNPFDIRGDIPYFPGHPEYCWGHRAMKIKSPGQKIFFIDAQDIWVDETGADYKIWWDKLGHTGDYKTAGTWRAVFYRHNEGANIQFFDGHTEYLRKQQVFLYDSTGKPDTARNDSIWFTNPSNRK